MNLHPFFASFYPWRWIEEPLARDPEAALARDTELVRAIARGEAGKPHRQSQYLLKSLSQEPR